MYYNNTEPDNADLGSARADSLTASVKEKLAQQLAVEAASLKVEPTISGSGADSSVTIAGSVKGSAACNSGTADHDNFADLLRCDALSHDLHPLRLTPLPRVISDTQYLTVIPFRLCSWRGGLQNCAM